MEHYDEYGHIINNYRAIEALSIAVTSKKGCTPQLKTALSEFKGFGATGLLFADVISNPDSKWSKTYPELKRTADIIELTFPNDKEKIFESIKNSALTSYYTPAAVADCIAKFTIDSFRDINNAKGSLNILEPSAGSGVFLSAIDRATKEKHSVTAIEKDFLTAAILNESNPEAIVMHQPFEIAKQKLPANHFDIIISNIPFGDIPVFDPRFAKSKDHAIKESTAKIHNYYFTANIELLKDMGMIAFITTSGFTDSPSNESIRKYMAEQGHILASIKLPTNLFESSNAKVQSSLILFMKDSTKREINFLDNDFIKNTGEKHAAAICDSIEKSSNRFGKVSDYYKFNGSYSSLSEILQNKLAQSVSTYRESVNISFSEKLSSIESIVATAAKPSGGQLSLFDVLDNTIPAIKKPVTYPLEIYPWLQNDSLVYHPKEMAVGRLMLPLDEKSEAIFTPITIDNRKVKAHIELIAIRDSYHLLYNGEHETRQPQPELRDQLNYHYDQFYKFFGSLNDPKNKPLLQLHESRQLLSGLEINNNGEFQKSDIFTKPLFEENLPANLHPKEALDYVMDAVGYPDIPLLEKLTGTDFSYILPEISDTVFYNAINNQFEHVSGFLNGNLYYKSEQIQASLQSIDDAFLKTEALRGLEYIRTSIPLVIDFDDIGIELGERWIPDDMHQRFANHIFNIDSARVRLLDSIDTYKIKINPTDYNSLVNNLYAVKTASYQTYNGVEVLTHAMLSTTPAITKKIYVGEKTINVPDTDAIQLFKNKTDVFKLEFKKFIATLSLEDKTALSKIYHEKFRATISAPSDGHHLKFKDLRFFTPLDYQRDAVWHTIKNRGGVIDLPPGAGKTLIMIMAAHEMKRLRMVIKPVIVSLKSTVAQIKEHFDKAYPNDRVLIPNENDFTPSRRNALFQQITNNNWDCIILTNEQFEKIPIPMNIQKQLVEEELYKLEEDKKVIVGENNFYNRGVQRELEKSIVKLETKLLNLQAGVSKDEHVFDLSKMGIDFIQIDESQNYKNLFFRTKHYQVSGLGNPEGSQRAFNMFMAIRTLQENKQADLQVSFLSGSTIKNSIVELYNIFNYLQPNKLRDCRIDSFDRWAAMFAQKSTDFEFSVTNEVKMKERFRTFIKVPELIKVYHDIAFYIHPNKLKLDKPKLNQTLVEIEPTERQKAYCQKLIDFAKTGDPGPLGLHYTQEQIKTCKMLICTDLGKKMTLDLRMVVPHAPDEDNSKLSVCCSKLASIYRESSHYKGVQLVFLDIGTPGTNGFAAYQAIKDKLVNTYSIAADQIAFAHDAATNAQKAALYTKIQNGDMRIVLGSTQKLGTGVNVQDKIIAIHHLDIPWTPEDLKQRNGRGERQGNIAAKHYNNNTVDSFVYATKQSIDIFRFQLLNNKQIFIDQIKTNELGARRIDEGDFDDSSALSFADFVATLSGNTLLLDKMKLEMQIFQLEKEKRVFIENTISINAKISTLEQTIVSTEKTLSNLVLDQRKLESSAPPTGADGKKIYEFQLQGKTYTDTKLFGAALLDTIALTALQDGQKKIIGQFRGFDMIMHRSNLTNYETKLYASNSDTNHAVHYTATDGVPNKEPVYAGQYFIHALGKIPSLIEYYANELERHKRDRNMLDTQKTEWPKENKLNEAKEKLSEIKGELDAIEKKQNAVENIKEAVVAEESANNYHKLKR
jgi:N12 class adenine-specific DNA methylase/tRNA1(Val) A37 N6-methylase TrmN6